MSAHTSRRQAIASPRRALSRARRWRLIAALGVLALLCAPGVAGAVPTSSLQDSAVGSGSTRFFSDFNFNVTSGPSGENPAGFSTTDGFGQHFVATSISCLSVSGNTATYAGTIEQNVFGFGYYKVTVVDNGPGGSADSYAAEGYYSPQDCSTTTGDYQAQLSSGDIAVVDSPAPTSKDQCKDGGYGQFGFKDQGQCVAYVDQHPKG